VKSPYNLNVLTQRVGAYALSKIDMMTTYTHDIMDERERIENELKKLRVTLYPSQANFVFFQSSVENLFSKLLEKGILIRAFDGNLKSYYRVTVGEKEENEALINALKEIII
jgi:histidinol-phosphate aminotransferase